MKPTNEYIVNLADLKNPILKNPFDPAKGDISAYMRYLRYNTPEAKPVKYGKWLPQIFKKPICSVCGESCVGLHAFDYKLTDFCPNCGADMRSESRAYIEMGEALAEGLVKGMQEGAENTELKKAIAAKMPTEEIKRANEIIKRIARR